MDKITLTIGRDFDKNLNSIFNSCHFGIILIRQADFRIGRGKWHATKFDFQENERGDTIITMDIELIKIMKFKYNPSERKLWKIEENHLYEVSEQDRHGTQVRFRLEPNHWLTFHTWAGLDPKITVYYAKSLKNGELVHYEKKINPGWLQLETIFEFTETDRIAD